MALPQRNDPFQGVKVEVVSEGRPLDLYDDPEAAENGVNLDLYSRSHYVQATTNAKFVVRVTISAPFRLFNLRPTDVVRASVSYDGYGLYNASNANSRRIMEDRKHNRPTTYEFCRTSQYCKVTRQWQRGDTVFSALAVSDEAPRANLSPDQTKNLGCIQIKIERLRQHSQRTTLPDVFPTDEAITAVSEKMIKGKAVGNVTSIQNTSVHTPRSYEFVTSRIDGEGGKALRFEIRYRSKSTLQSLGCIPRTPTPEPDLKEENRFLRERLALLERNGACRNIKAEASQSLAGIQREREAVGGENARKRNRTSEPEVVDLTVD